MKWVLVSVVLCVGLGVGAAHLLPQALEDVHAFVQSELQQRSQGEQRKLGLDAPPSGGPIFQTSQTQTYIGIPVVIQKEVRFSPDGKFQQQDQATAGTQAGPPLPRGLLPPGPMQGEQGEGRTGPAAQQPQVIPANLVGPSTFVSDAPREREEGAREPRQGEGGATKSMEGWYPLDGHGSKLAKAVGGQIRIEKEQDEQEQKPSREEREPDYRGTGYSVRGEGKREEEEDRNELEILPTNSVKLEDIIVGKKANLREASDEARGQRLRFPVNPGGEGSPKVVIHAQNVIIRGDGSEISANNDTDSGGESGPGQNVRQIPAYGGVPQLNNFLREQLRQAAMNQLLQGGLQLQTGPFGGQPFPRPLSLREIAQAARNGGFPPELQGQEPLTSPSQSQMQISIPHFVRMNPDAAPSIQQQARVPHPGLGGLYRNILQQEAAGGAGGHFDPRAPLEYSLLAALSGQRLKTPGVPSLKPKPDYGDSVAYSIGKDKKPIQILEAAESPEELLKTGSLRGMSEHLLKQIILQELQELQQEAPRAPSYNQLLSSGLHNPARLPLRHLKPRPAPYGTNSHPFAYLAEGGDGAHSAHGTPDIVYDETFEYTLPPGMSVDDYMGLDGVKSPKRPRYPPPGYPEDADPDSGAVPLNRDTLVEFGKGLLNQALVFSRHHNPLTFLNRVRKLPPVKVDLYKVPMGVPEGLMEKLPENWRSDGGSSRRPGAKRGKSRRRQQSRKKNVKRN